MAGKDKEIPPQAAQTNPSQTAQLAFCSRGTWEVLRNTGLSGETFNELYGNFYHWDDFAGLTLEILWFNMFTYAIFCIMSTSQLSLVSFVVVYPLLIR